MTAREEKALDGHIILVTGAANGIGAAVALAYAKQGATVILLDKDVPALQQSYDQIVANATMTPAIYPLDLKGASIDDYQTLANSIEQNFGQLTGLVHCAASLGQLAPVQHQAPKTWLETLHINLTAPYMLTRACLPLMKSQNQGSIIFTTDQYKDNAYWSAYGVSKAAIETLSLQLADELEQEGKLRVNCVDPGRVQTRLLSNAFPAINPEQFVKPEDVVDVYIDLMLPSSSSTGQVVSAQK